jgi:hypothetical protein
MNESASFLKINGLSYADWEDEADRLRTAAASGRSRSRKRDISRAAELIAKLERELESIKGVQLGLEGIDKIRVQCTKDLLVALLAGLNETLRRLQSRLARAEEPKDSPTPAAAD